MPYRAAILLIALIVTAYWARVVRMARKARKLTGRAANFLPRETIGALLRIIWIPIVLIWIAHPWMTALGAPRLTIVRPLLARWWIAGPAALAAAACLQLSFVCWKAMGRNWRMGIDPGEQTSLVLTGPYTYVRHPIYALSQAMMLATMLALPSPLMLAAGTLHLVLLQWEARREERYLRSIHAGQYEAYCAGVGRFIPRIFPAG